MQAFLVAPEVTKKKDRLVKVWAKQVRDLSYDIEDCLAEFTVHVGSQRLSHSEPQIKSRRSEQQECTLQLDQDGGFQHH
nr:unnamed protein product [Digitaria exilis]